MAVEDISTYNNNDKKKLSQPMATNNEFEVFSGFQESQLCVPQDSLDDIDWFPNFTDDIISLGDFFLSSVEQEEYDERKNKTGGGSGGVVEQTIGFTNKKQRSKRGGKRSGYWSAKQDMMNCSMISEEGGDSGGAWNISSDYYVKRKCSHCSAENTPQWRIGPLGPKTLCNACGVRYKSGRLVPEYRPAASPTFDIMKHSNFHKKILRKSGGGI